MNDWYTKCPFGRVWGLLDLGGIRTPDSFGRQFCQRIRKYTMVRFELTIRLVRHWRVYDLSIITTWPTWHVLLEKKIVFNTLDLRLSRKLFYLYQKFQISNFHVGITFCGVWTSGYLKGCKWPNLWGESLDVDRMHKVHTIEKQICSWSLIWCVKRQN